MIRQARSCKVLSRPRAISPRDGGPFAGSKAPGGGGLGPGAELPADRPHWIGCSGAGGAFAVGPLLVLQTDEDLQGGAGHEVPAERIAASKAFTARVGACQPRVLTSVVLAQARGFWGCSFQQSWRGIVLYNAGQQQICIVIAVPSQDVAVVGGGVQV